MHIHDGPRKVKVRLAQLQAPSLSFLQIISSATNIQLYIPFGLRNILKQANNIHAHNPTDYMQITKTHKFSVLHPF